MMSRDCTISIDKARRELGYEPVISRSEGLKDCRAEADRRMPCRSGYSPTLYFFVTFQPPPANTWSPPFGTRLHVPSAAPPLNVPVIATSACVSSGNS